MFWQRYILLVKNNELEIFTMEEYFCKNSECMYVCVHTKLQVRDCRELGLKGCIF
jgi:hypothetical protein